MHLLLSFDDGHQILGVVSVLHFIQKISICHLCGQATLKNNP